MKRFDLAFLQTRYALILPLLFGFPTISDATQYMSALTTVARLNMSDSSQGTNQGWVTLNNVTSLGNCPLNAGLVLMRIKDDVPGQRQFAALLASVQTGSSVQAWVDDTLVDSTGNCYLLFLQVP